MYFPHRPFEPDTDNAGAGSSHLTIQNIPQNIYALEEKFFVMASHRKNTTAMIEGALCIALCIVLEKINIFSMPQGGSVDFELIPLLLFTYRRGLGWGLQIGFVTGLVKILLGAYFLSVSQVALDYPLAYACVGLAALHPKILGLLIAAAGQITCSVISGVVFFAEYAPEGQSPLVYSLMYNVPVLGAKYILSGIVAMFMWKVLERDLPAVE